MSIFKDTFRGYVRNQLELREELISIGNPDKFNEHEGNTNRRNASHTFTNWNKEEVTIKPGSHHTYTLNKQCVIRATSLTDYVSDVGLDIGDLGGQSFNRLKGASLSQNFILQGGILSDFARSFQTTDENGNPQGLRKVRKLDQVRASFPKPGLKTNLGYGDFAIGADASEDGYGIVPMPGIIDATIRTKSAYGSLREGKINFEVHNQRQLEVMEMLYMRPGYMVLVEWGWCPYINNKGTIENHLKLVENASDYDIYTNKITQTAVYNHINALKESSNGNYDGMLGFVKNFGFQAREDGGYSCFTELSSIGEVIESIKVPPVSIINTTRDINPSGNDIEDDGADIIVNQGVATVIPPPTFDQKRSLLKDLSAAGALEDVLTTTEIALAVNPITANLAMIDNILSGLGIIDGFQATAKKKAQLQTARSAGIGNVTRDTFDKAIATKIFPSFNGLLGLINVINNYTIFGHGLNESDDSNEAINKVFEYYDDIQGGKVDNDDLSETEANKLNAKLNSINTILEDQAKASQQPVRPLAYKEFLRNLVTFQSADFETFLLNLLNLKTKGELKDYIIPTTSSTSGGKEEGIDQAYIRWDTLAVLINAYLIPKTEKGLPPVNVVTDRIYTIDKDTSKLDPLLFCPIVSYVSDSEDNSLLDFSCDANTCILPLQFDPTLAGDASVVIDPTGIEDTIGYIPDIKRIPAHLIASMFGYNENNITKDIQYKGQSIYDKQNPHNDKGEVILNDTDKLRRIGNIFLNVSMLLNIAEKNSDNPSYTIGLFIKDVFKEVNKVCPNHNFVLTDDKESNNIFIIDLPVDNSEVPMDLHEFLPFSNKNILRNFDYTSNVPSAMSATIAVQGQDARSIQDIDGVTFAAFNRSIKNRILSNDPEPTWDKTKKDIQSAGSKMLTQQTELYRSLNNYRLAFFRNIKLADNDKSIIGEGNIKGILQAYQKNSTYLSTTQGKGSTFNSVIPLEFSATLDGISGMVIGNIFKIHKDRLPRAYHKSNIGFILFNEEQKITAGGDWTTDISGKMTILPEKKITVKGTVTIMPGGVEEVTSLESAVALKTTINSETLELDQYQDLITDINKAIPGSTLYLKKIKQNFIETIDDEDVDSSLPIGYTNVRMKNMKWVAGAKGPLVDNEHDKTLGIGDYDDNSYGMFDSWNNGGELLGVVKISEDEEILNDDHYIKDESGVPLGRWVIKYKDNKCRILAENVSKYIKDVSESDTATLPFIFAFEEVSPSQHGIPEDTNTYLRPIPVEPWSSTGDGVWSKPNPQSRGDFIHSQPHIKIDNKQYFFNEELTSKGSRSILKEDTTDVQDTWFSVQFTENVNDIFLGGYVREGTNIKTNGADEITRIKGGLFSEGGSLSEFTKIGGNKNGYDCWMHFSTLAITKESATQADVINNLEESSNSQSEQF